MRTVSNFAFSDRVSALLTRASWSPDRLVPHAFDEVNHPAVKVMASLGGVSVPEGAPGLDAQFLSADQVRADWVELSDLVAYWAEELKTDLLPLGECERKHAELWMAGDGRVFVYSLITDVFFFAGDRFENALDAVLFGRRQGPLLTCRDLSVLAYGEEHKRGDPRNYYEASYGRWCD